MLKENERIDIIPGSDLKIIQDKNKFSYGTDAIFLSSFARAKGKMVDLGTGTGIIPLRLYAKDQPDFIYGVEIQEEVADMAKRSIRLNKLEDKIEILHMDLNDLPNLLGKATVDVVTSNPPYMRSGGALINSKENFALSRHEIACSLEDIVRVADYLLKPLGRFYLIHRPDRLVDIIYNLRKYKLEPKYIRFVQAKLRKRPNLLLIEAVKQGKADLKFIDPLIVYNEDNSYSEEIYQIYGLDGRNEKKNEE